MTPRTKAVMFVGLGGNTGQYEEVVALCRERGLKLILDASHMSGSRLNGRHVGGEADAAIFSFQAVKNLPTADAGMVCFADASLDAAARKWSWLGISKDTYSRTVGGGAYKWYYDVEHVGFKYHGSSVMAAIGLASLKHLDQDNAYRREIATWYDEFLQQEAAIERVPVTPGCVSSRHLYQVQLERRDEVMLALHQEQIYPGVHYRDNTVYPMYAYAQGTCPRSHAASDRILSLPMHLRLSRSDVARVSDAIRKAVGRVAR